jgi:hypothetical protein
MNEKAASSSLVSYIALSILMWVEYYAHIYPYLVPVVNAAQIG